MHMLVLLLHCKCAYWNGYSLQNGSDKMCSSRCDQYDNNETEEPSRRHLVQKDIISKKQYNKNEHYCSKRSFIGQSICESVENYNTMTTRVLQTVVKNDKNHSDEKYSNDDIEIISGLNLDEPELKRPLTMQQQNSSNKGTDNFITTSQTKLITNKNEQQGKDKSTSSFANLDGSLPFDSNKPSDLKPFKPSQHQFNQQFQASSSLRSCQTTSEQSKLTTLSEHQHASNPVTDDSLSDSIDSTTQRTMLFMKSGLEFNRKLTELLTDHIPMCWFSSQLKRDNVVTYNNEPSEQVFTQGFNLDIVRHACQALNIINTELQNFTDIHRSLLEIERFAKDNWFMDNERTLMEIKAMYERYNTFKMEIIDMLHLFINFHSNIVVFSGVVFSILDKMQNNTIAHMKKEHETIVNEIRRVRVNLQTTILLIVHSVLLVEKCIIVRLKTFHNENTVREDLPSVSVPKSSQQSKLRIAGESSDISQQEIKYNPCEFLEMVYMLTKKVEIEKDQLRKAIERFAFPLTYGSGITR